MKEYGKILKGLYHSRIKGECIFCRIVEGKDKAKILYRDEKTMVFAPLKSGILAEGHLLVIPKQHHESLLDIDNDDLNSVMKTAKQISQTLKKETEFEGFNLLNANGEAAQQSVSHFHVHLVPRKVDDGLNLWPETGYSESEYKQVYNELEKVLN